MAPTLRSFKHLLVTLLLLLVWDLSMHFHNVPQDLFASWEQAPPRLSALLASTVQPLPSSNTNMHARLVSSPQLAALI